MTVGSDHWKGLAVPLFGDFEIRQNVLGNDILTITGATSQTGDFLVARIADETEMFVVSADGNITVPGTFEATGAQTFTGAVTFTDFPVLNAALLTTKPTTGFTTGELLFWDAPNVRWLGIASGANTTWHVAMTDN